MAVKTLIMNGSDLSREENACNIPTLFSEGPAACNCGVFAFPAVADLRRPFEHLGFAMSVLPVWRWIKFLVRMHFCLSFTNF